MKQKYSPVIFGLVGLLMINGNNLKAQSANPLVHGVGFTNPDTNIENAMKGAIEDISKRTLYSSMWITKSGEIIAKYSSMLVNYPDSKGVLQPIDLTLHSDPRGWVADKQPSPCYFHSDRSTAINIGGKRELTYNKNCTINGMPLDQQIVSMEGSNVKLDLSEGVHKHINFVPGGIKTDYVFDKSLEGGISITEEVEIPAGYTLQRDDKNGFVQPGGWTGDYFVVSPKGKIMAKFLAGECYDAKKHWCFANYSVQKKDGKNLLVTSIPNVWLSKAEYPVTLDPLVIGDSVMGDTSRWTGGTSSSCLYPNFHTDSILVTIPANITIDFFTVDYAYVSQTNINDQIPINDGIFYLSTSCGKTDTISCANLPGHGDTAGICYLLPNENIQNPLTCCYGPSCSPKQFWLAAHLSRRYGGSGCDTTTIWYSAGFYTGYQYYFSASVIGHTVRETSLKYLPSSQCSNSCNILLDADIIDGVPPYTVKHPWAARDTVVGHYGSCVSEGIALMNLKIPGANCPFTCLSPDTTITVPPPTVIDFCGDTVKNLKSQTITLKPVPVITATPLDSIVCSGSPVTLNVSSCVPGTTFNWTGSDNASGVAVGGSISDNTADTSQSPLKVTYKISGTVNGCNSDTIIAKGIINPFPLTTLSGVDSIQVGQTDQLKATGGGAYSWSPATGLSCTTCPNPVATPTITTTYYLTVTDSGGCQIVRPFTIVVIDLNIVVPNVITPNTPGPLGINNLFYVKNLQFYPNSKLSVYDRWGKQVYTSSNYQNNWNGGGQSDGVYYYLLTLSNGKKYQGFFQLIK